MFYFLIFFTAVIRAVWFFVPSDALEPSYAPEAVYAFEGSWLGTFFSQLLLSVGTLSLFSIFILIVIYWADLLRRVFKESSRPSRPMVTFLGMVGFLSAVEAANAVAFLAGAYSSQGMILVDAVLLSLIALVCSVEVSIFSHRFRTVLRTLGAINQVSTEEQVRRIVRVTVAGNVFFLVRAACEVAVGSTIFHYWKRHKSFAVVFGSTYWDIYIIVAHASEVLILGLMLWILQGRAGDGGSGSGGGGTPDRSGSYGSINAEAPGADEP
ncbi:unnamed protein product [Phaeothamnion confervicola]